jgi:hypothetical protein
MSISEYGGEQRALSPSHRRHVAAIARLAHHGPAVFLDGDLSARTR